jgi:hypothetical protein
MRNRYVFALDALLFAAAAVGAFVLRFDLKFIHTQPEFWFFLLSPSMHQDGDVFVPSGLSAQRAEPATRSWP